jgi:ABC-2 type transport system ATP-binding protein
VHLEDDADGERAMSALAEMSSERPWLDDHTVRAPVRHRNGAIAEAVRRLDDANVPIADIALRRPTLDDVFINLTGHAAEEEEGVPA